MDIKPLHVCIASFRLWYCLEGVLITLRRIECSARPLFNRVPRGNRSPWKENDGGCIGTSVFISSNYCQYLFITCIAFLRRQTVFMPFSQRHRIPMRNDQWLIHVVLMPEANLKFHRRHDGHAQDRSYRCPFLDSVSKFASSFP